MVMFLANATTAPLITGIFGTPEGISTSLPAVGTPPHQLFPSNQLLLTPVHVVVVDKLMVTTAFELRPDGKALQPRLSVTEVSTYVLLTAGVTAKLYGLFVTLVTVIGPPPLIVYLNVHGLIPVRVAVRFVLPFSQILAEPERLPVTVGPTLMTAEELLLEGQTPLATTAL